MKPANDNGSLLAARRRKYDIPEAPYAPLGKNCLIYRIPEEERSAGGLILPETTREPKSHGVLLAAGLAALDILQDHLVELGDIVWFGRYAGDEREVRREAEAVGQKILQVKVEDILGSVDARARVEACDLGLDDDGNLIYIKRAS